MRFRATVTITNEPVAATSSTSAIKDDIIMYYHNDHLGTPLFMTDEVGAIVWRREQKPFGETTYLRGDVTENLRFPGQYFDAETGLAQNWHRDYTATLGRYVEADPIKDDAGLYTYALNRPISRVDRKGLASCTYSISSHTLACDSSCGKPMSYIVGPDGVFSGYGKCKNNNSDDCINADDEGPIPPGSYKIKRYIGKDKFWVLDPGLIDRGLYKLRLLRGGFMLHPGSLSLGCITVDRNNATAMSKYDKINSLLLKEDGKNELEVYK